MKTCRTNPKDHRQMQQELKLTEDGTGERDPVRRGDISRPETIIAITIEALIPGEGSGLIAWKRTG